MTELALVTIPPGIIFGILGFFVRKWVNDIENRISEDRKDLGAILAATKFDLKEIDSKLRSLELEVKTKNDGAFQVLAFQVAETQKRFGELEKIQKDLNVLFERVRGFGILPRE
jgi:hypothetical protein